MAHVDEPGLLGRDLLGHRRDSSKQKWVGCGAAACQKRCRSPSRRGHDSGGIAEQSVHHANGNGPGKSFRAAPAASTASNRQPKMGILPCNNLIGVARIPIRNRTIRGHPVRPHVGHKGWIEVFGRIKNMAIDPVDGIQRAFLREEVDRFLHQSIEATDFIQAVDVIHVMMGDKNSIAPSQARPQGLYRKSGPQSISISRKCRLGLKRKAAEVRGGTVSRIAAGTHRAIATKNRHARTRPGAQQHDRCFAQRHDGSSVTNPKRD